MTRGEIYLFNFGDPFGSEPGYFRPVMIAQSSKENLENLNTTVVIPLTSNTIYAEYEGNVFVPKKYSGLRKDSVVLVHQIITVDKQRLGEKIGKVPKMFMEQIDDAIDYVLKD